MYCNLYREEEGYRDPVFSTTMLPCPSESDANRASLLQKTKPPSQAQALIHRSCWPWTHNPPLALDSVVPSSPCCCLLNGIFLSKESLSSLEPMWFIIPGRESRKPVIEHLGWLLSYPNTGHSLHIQFWKAEITNASKPVTTHVDMRMSTLVWHPHQCKTLSPLWHPPQRTILTIVTPSSEDHSHQCNIFPRVPSFQCEQPPRHGIGRGGCDEKW